jgi:hypothetical protein
MKKFALVLLSSSLIFASAGCSNFNSKTEYPKTKEERELERMGKLTGEDGFVLFGGKKRGSSAADAINVNAYLWRAGLDVIHFMPLVSADPFGGTILTDWYVSPNNPNERMKINIFITSAELRSDAVKVSAFRQIKKNGVWQDTSPNAGFTAGLEEKILLRARQIKYSSIK